METKQLTIAKKLDANISEVITSNLLGFEKAFVIASSISTIKEMLTDEYMKPIMALQGQANGFKTDKDKEGGYSISVVKTCLIDATLAGVQPYGNHFNIICGNYYITKEGFGYLLEKCTDLSWEIIPGIPRMNNDKTSAVISMKIKWNGQERDIEFAIKMNQYMGVDGVIGKATRKARAWLYHTFKHVELPEGDITTDVKIISSAPLVRDLEQEKQSLKERFEKAKSKLTEEHCRFAERVINGNEEASFTKLDTILKFAENGN